MPNYSLVINSKFRPFSYAELAQPVAMSTQAHQEIENAYGDLNTKASIWEEMANEQTDPNAYKMYKTYANDLKAQADRLAKEGLNTTSRRDMLNMRARYSKEITPIENAYTARANEIKEQTAGRAQGIVYEGDASVASLDRYLKDPAIKYRFANSQEGFKRLASAATAISKELREYGRGKKLDAYTNTWLQQHGYKSTEIEQAIRDIDGALRGDGNVRGTNVLQSLLANEMQTAGVNDWNIAAKMDYYNRVAPALYQAAGQTNVTTFEDYGAKLRAQESMQRRLKALDNNQNTLTGYGLNPINIYSTREFDKIKNRIKEFSDFFYKDKNGNYRMNQKGLKAYYATGKVAGDVMVTPEGTTIRTAKIGKGVNDYSDFRKFIDSLGGAKYIKDGKMSPGNLGNLWSNYIGKLNAKDKYDAMKYTEYVEDLPRTKQFQDTYKGKLSRALGNIDYLQEVDLDSKSGTWETIGKLKKSDIMSDDYQIIARVPTEIGTKKKPNKPTTTLLIMDKDGNTRRFISPSGIHTTAENARDAAIINKLYIQRRLQDPNLSDMDRLKLERFYEQQNQLQYMYGMQLDYVNAIEDQKSKPFYNP